MKMNYMTKILLCLVIFLFPNQFWMGLSDCRYA